MKNLLKYIRLKLLLPMYIHLDGKDNSITVSKNMYRAMMILGLEKGNKIYAFKVGNDYGFAVNPEQLKDVETNFYELQYNGKYKTIGFAPTCPSVAWILNDYGLPHDTMKKTRVSIQCIKGQIYFKIHLKRKGM